MNFSEKVYNLTKKIPKSKITTYKIIAQKLKTKAYRAVGTSLKNNPYAPGVPCHRVIKSDGSIGGFMGKTKGTAIKKKINLLKKEGIEIKKNKINLSKYLYKFN